MEKIYPLSVEEMYEDPRGLRFKRIELIERLIAWAEFNTQKNVSKEAYDAWHEFFISEYELLKEKHLGMHIFIELSRAHFLLTYPTLMKERAEIEKNPEVDADYDLLWRGIMKMTQSQLMDELIRLTQEMQWGNVDGFERSARLLFTRCGIFFTTPCDAKTLDIENLRVIHDEVNYRPAIDFVHFVAIYFHSIQRRLFYMKECTMNPIHLYHESITKFKTWFETVVCAAIGPSGYEKNKERACEEAYKIPGDDEWFTYRNPNALLNRGAVLDTIRKSLAKKYYAESAVSLEATLSTVDSRDYYGRCSRLFVLYAIDAYMQMKFRLDWYDIVVIEHEKLYADSVKLFLDKLPHLVEFTNSFCVHHKGQFYQSNSIYETLAFWFDIVDVEFDSTILGCRLKLD